MVDVFGNEIIKAYTGGTSVKEIYAYGVLVWPTGYYIFWTPMSMSGTFTMEGETYNFEDYSGSFRFSGGVITSSAFQSTSVEYINTNATLTFHNAFAFCSSLVSAELPNCSAVWTNCFTNCTSLESISLPVCTLIGGNAFESCKFSYLDLPKVETIEGNGFRHCKSLTSVDLPECSSVGQYAFQDCTSLKTINLPKCTNIEQGAFGGDREIESVSLPECSVIGSSAFTYCTSFSYLELMGSSMCQLVGNDQFLNTPFASCQGTIMVPGNLLTQYRTDSKWSSLTCVLRPETSDYYIAWLPISLNSTFSLNGTTYNMSNYSGYFTGFNGVITSSAFQSRNITQVDTNAYSLSRYVFDGCSLLSKAYLSNCLYLGRYAFQSCYALQSIELPRLSMFGGRTFSNCSSLSYVNAPVATEVGIYDFLDCHSLQAINIPECTSIGTQAFGRCYKLTDVSLPKCSYIGYNVFISCSSLSEISLPACTTLGAGAFRSCVNLKTVTIDNSSFCSIDMATSESWVSSINYPFYDTPIGWGYGSIYVPSSMVNRYKTAKWWSSYSSRIFPIP